MRTEKTSELEAGFASFVDAARRLEERYDELKARAALVDRELATSNAQLAETLAEREVILSALPVGVVALHADGSVQWSNAEARRLDALFSDADRCWEALEDGVHRFGSGTIQVRRVPLPQGGRLVVGEDRSQIAQLEREVDRLDRLAGLSELAMGVAHEIKNPLNGVSGFASMLPRAEDLETARRYGARVLDGLQRVDDIVRQMLSFARPEGHRAVLRPLRDVLRDAAVTVGIRGPAIDVAGDGLDEPVDAVVLVRALENLFRNSVESSEDDVRISVDSRLEGDRLVIEIADDGPGIAVGLRERVFQPFVSDKPTGTGLGLPLTARVLSFLDGRISLCPPEHGTRFRLDLPRAVEGEGP